jgi:hypothetical protein
VRQIGASFTQAMPGTGWGMTETNRHRRGIGGEDYLTRPASSGRASLVLDLRVVDERGQPLPAGERGELLVRGTSLFQGYWNRPEANAQAFVDGDWFRTGDVAYFDDEGFVFIVDRIKDLIIRGGENIGCGQVEAALLMHPLVHEAAVYAVPDERLGEEVGATVHGDPGAGRRRAARLPGPAPGEVRGAALHRGVARAAAAHAVGQDPEAPDPPLLLTNLLHSLTATWGAVWAGRSLGADALTAVATATVLMYMVMGSAMGIGTAAGVAIGQSLGARDMAAVKRVVGCAIAFIGGLSLLLAAAGWALTPLVVDGMGVPAASRGFAITHLRMTCLTMPSIFTYMVMMMMMRSSGDARTPFRFTLVWIGGAVALTPLFVSGVGSWGGFGMAGLGLAHLPLQHGSAGR